MCVCPRVGTGIGDATQGGARALVVRRILAGQEKNGGLHVRHLVREVPDDCLRAAHLAQRVHHLRPVRG